MISNGIICMVTNAVGSSSGAIRQDAVYIALTQKSLPRSKSGEKRKGRLPSDHVNRLEVPDSVYIMRGMNCRFNLSIYPIPEGTALRCFPSADD
jgi:hypothetical protein